MAVLPVMREAHAMTDLVKLHEVAADGFDRHVDAIRDDQWSGPTPCTDWDVRTLVNHLVYEAKWAPDLFHGKTVAEVGDRYEGDLVGDDPVGAWKSGNAEARAAINEPGALDRIVHLSFGDVPGSEYLSQLVTDLAIHGWDLARAIGDDETIDPQLVEWLLPYAQEHADEISGSGMFAPPIEVGADADPQTRLLALMGRKA
jgi:uncharacterized protein (TIGR03086 family)